MIRKCNKYFQTPEFAFNVFNVKKHCKYVCSTPSCAYNLKAVHVGASAPPVVTCSKTSYDPGEVFQAVPPLPPPPKPPALGGLEMGLSN